MTVAVVATAGLVGTPAAEAAPVDPGQPSTIVRRELPRAVDNHNSKPRASAECAEQVGFHGHIGYKICNTGHLWLNWGTTESFFVIGTDHAVHYIHKDRWGNVSGWQSLGGWLQGGVYKNYRHPTNPYDLGIWSIGGDGRIWCDNLIPVPIHWSGWYPCS